MKINQDYLKGLLEAFQASEHPTTTINILKTQGFNYEDDLFIFHLQILNDMGLLEGEKGNLGMTTGACGDISWAIIPLRLTVQGHSFIEALQNEDVWSSIKSGFQNASLETLYKVSKDLLEGYLKKKISTFIEI